MKKENLAVRPMYCPKCRARYWTAYNRPSPINPQEHYHPSSGRRCNGVAYGVGKLAGKKWVLLGDDKMTHTKGRWEAQESIDFHAWEVVRTFIDDSGKEGTVLVAGDLQPDEAQLIAAAPELLEICKELLDEAKEMGCKRFDEISEIINRAEGRRKGIK